MFRIYLLLVISQKQRIFNWQLLVWDNLENNRKYHFLNQQRDREQDNFTSHEIDNYYTTYLMILYRIKAILIKFYIFDLN
jgi:hypothetical protein